MMWVGGDFGRDRSGAGRQQRLSACRRSGGRRLQAVGDGAVGSGDSATDRDGNSGDPRVLDPTGAGSGVTLRPRV
jgi:hypothetical protein